MGEYTKCPDCQSESWQGHRVGCRWFMAGGPIHHMTEEGAFHTETDPFRWPAQRRQIVLDTERHTREWGIRITKALEGEPGTLVIVNQGLPTESTLYVRFE